MNLFLKYAKSTHFIDLQPCRSVPPSPPYACHTHTITTHLLFVIYISRLVRPFRFTCHTLCCLSNGFCVCLASCRKSPRLAAERTRAHRRARVEKCLHAALYARARIFYPVLSLSVSCTRDTRATTSSESRGK